MSTPTTKKATRKARRAAARAILATPEVQAVRPARKKSGKEKQIKTQVGVSNMSNYLGGSAKPNRGAIAQMQQKLTNQEAGLTAYMAGLTSPTVPCRAPIVLGEFELDTNTYSYVFNGTVTCTAAGFGYVAWAPDAWTENGNDGGPLDPYLAYTTQGYPVWYSPAAGAATTTQTYGAASGADHAKLQLQKLDPGFTAATRYRNTAIIASAWPDSPATTTQGDIVFAVATSEEALNAGVLNGATFASVTALPQEYVGHYEAPLANWNPEHCGHTCMVPFSENCFVFQYASATGNSVAGKFGGAFIIAGAASGQTLRFRIEYKYETTAPVSYMTSVENVLGARAPMSVPDIVPHLSALKPAILHGPSNKLPGLGMAAIQNADSGLFGKIKQGLTSSGLGASLQKVIANGVSAIPYVGGFLSKLVSAF